MSTTRASSVLSSVLLAAAAALGSAAPAQAAVYTGTWDPAYGGIFPDLGWKASALFNVPDPCLALGNATHVPISGACSGFDVLSAKVSFYNVADPSTILASYALNPDVFVNGIDIADGKLAGVETSYFNPFVSDLSIAGNGEYGFSLILFDSTKAQLVYAKPPSLSAFCATVGDPRCGFSANDAHGVFAPVPEPETYALMLAGLGALGVVARRRRR